MEHVKTTLEIPDRFRPMGSFWAPASQMTSSTTSLVNSTCARSESVGKIWVIANRVDPVKWPVFAGLRRSSAVNKPNGGDFETEFGSPSATRRKFALFH